MPSWVLTSPSLPRKQSSPFRSSFGSIGLEPMAENSVKRQRGDYKITNTLQVLFFWTFQLQEHSKHMSENALNAKYDHFPLSMSASIDLLWWKYLELYLKDILSFIFLRFVFSYRNLFGDRRHLSQSHMPIFWKPNRIGWRTKILRYSTEICIVWINLLPHSSWPLTQDVITWSQLIFRLQVSK